MLNNLQQWNNSRNHLFYCFFFSKLDLICAEEITRPTFVIVAQQVNAFEFYAYANYAPPFLSVCHTQTKHLSYQMQTWFLFRGQNTKNCVYLSITLYFWNALFNHFRLGLSSSLCIMTEANQTIDLATLLPILVHYTFMKKMWMNRFLSSHRSNKQWPSIINKDLLKTPMNKQNTKHVSLSMSVYHYFFFKMCSIFCTYIYFHNIRKKKLNTNEVFAMCLKY